MTQRKSAVLKKQLVEVLPVPEQLTKWRLLRMEIEGVTRETSTTKEE